MSGLASKQRHKSSPAPLDLCWKFTKQCVYDLLAAEVGQDPLDVWRRKACMRAIHSVALRDMLVITDGSGQIVQAL